MWTRPITVAERAVFMRQAGDVILETAASAR
jgi:hypothetical protein